MDAMSRALDETLLRDLECPVCKEYMLPPIKLCTGGHHLCSKCRHTFLCCPICRAKLSETRNMALESIASRVKYPCTNRQSGCLEKFSIEHIAEHHAGCVYGKIKCPFHLYETCSWNGLKSDLKQHGKAAHQGYFMEETRFHAPYLSGTLAVLSCFGELFTCYLQKRDGRFYGAVQLIGSSREASKYKCEFTLRATNGIEQISKTLLVNCYSEDFETIFHSGNCFNLDEQTVNNFVEQNELNLYIYVHKI